MSKLPHTMLAALVAAGAFAAPAAFASTSSAVAEINGFGYQLIDLNPHDGIAPAITFAAQPQLQQRYSYLMTQDWGGVDGGSGAGQSEVAAAGSHSRSTIAADGLRADVLAVSSGKTAQGESIAYQQVTFELTPFTGLLIHATGRLAAAPALDADAAWASAGLLFNAQLKSTVNGITEWDYISHAYGTLEGERSYDLRGYLQTWDHGAEGEFEWRTTATAWTTSPVPEPATWGMLAVGLLAAGAAARRRKH